jgi:hypothetical protein
MCPPTANTRASILLRVRRTCAAIVVCHFVSCTLSLVLTYLYEVPLEQHYDKPGPVERYDRRGKWIQNNS